MATNWGEGKFWIQTCQTLLKNSSFIAFYSCGGVGKYVHGAEAKYGINFKTYFLKSDCPVFEKMW